MQLIWWKGWLRNFRILKKYVFLCIALKRAWSSVWLILCHLNYVKIWSELKTETTVLIYTEFYAQTLQFHIKYNILWHIDISEIEFNEYDSLYWNTIETPILNPHNYLLQFNLSLFNVALSLFLSCKCTHNFLFLFFYLKLTT